MKTTFSEKYLRDCLSQARYHEFCIDIDRALTALNPVWKSIEEFPDVEGLEPPLACDILLVCGSVISYYGQGQQKKSFQEMANDVLTRARDLAEDIGDNELIAEAERQIGLAYFRLGQFENAIAYFRTLIARFTEAEQLTKPTCLRVQTNLLMSYVKNGEPVAAYDLLCKIEPEIKNSSDAWLKTIFYNQGAGVHLKAGNHKKAIPFLEKAVELSRSTRNTAYLGNALNNLALVYLNSDDPATAMDYAEQAADVYSRLNHCFVLGLVLDTKAQIQIAEGNLKDALLTIDESIKILEKGENYANLAESLWTRTRILALDDNKFEAVRQFTRLIQLAETRLNRLTVNTYISQFTQLLYLQSGNDFYEQAENYRIYLLDKALTVSGGVVTPTAARLGISHQSTSKILKKYPELCKKHSVRLKIRKTDSLMKKERRVKRPMLPVSVVKLKSDRLKHLGMLKGMTVRFERMPVRELDISKPVVIQNIERKYHCGILVDAFDMYAFEDGLGNIEATFIEEEILDAGQVTAVFDDDSQEFILLEDFI